ncbi:hypothetical protein CYMTET_17135 [Cymbomonas tetramitiformis]|uniref:Uncharacterized protein n=1 Tax=Cymbomonas tetramitiformis TaxID=36881 RepID=A0AAE0GB15_9CHLO|nr:hypothetical protein CYMTET_17135 [Cymbomonas tetramitiformis]|eukprot:gene3025-3845_t
MPRLAVSLFLTAGYCFAALGGLYTQVSSLGSFSVSSPVVYLSSYIPCVAEAGLSWGILTVTPANIAQLIPQKHTSAKQALSALLAYRGSSISRAANCQPDPLNATFNSKVLARMHSDRRSFLPLLSDKGTVRIFAEAVNLSVAEAFYVGQCDNLPKVSELPRSFVAKATHAAGCVLIVENSLVKVHIACERMFHRHFSTFTGAQITNEMLASSCHEWLRQMYRHSLTEWAYSQLTPTIIIEELLRGVEDGHVSEATVVQPTFQSTAGGASIADDFKCFAFDGVTRYIQHVHSRFGSKRDTYYDRGGRNVNVTLKHSASAPPWDPSVFTRFPGLLAGLIARCDYAARGLDFVRVDFLFAGGEQPGSKSPGSKSPPAYRLLLGEMTFYPGAGKHKWVPSSFDQELGRWWCPRMQ